MAWLRQSPRHIHATVVDYLTEHLDTLGWTTVAPPFGATQVRIQTFMPPESELTKITSGLLAITMGDEFDAMDEELGGPLHSQELPFFVDCFQGKSGHALALATDVRDIFRGRFSGTKRVLTVQDHTYATPVDVAGWKFEFTDVEREQIYRLPIYWQTVRCTASVDFPEEVW
jgi:hypothetical protein